MKIRCPFCKKKRHEFVKGVRKIHFYCPTVEFEVYWDIFSKKDQEEFYKRKEWRTLKGGKIEKVFD